MAKHTFPENREQVTCVQSNPTSEGLISAQARHINEPQILFFFFFLLTLKVVSILLRASEDFPSVWVLGPQTRGREGGAGETITPGHVPGLSRGWVGRGLTSAGLSWLILGALCHPGCPASPPLSTSQLPLHTPAAHLFTRCAQILHRLLATHLAPALCPFHPTLVSSC